MPVPSSAACVPHGGRPARKDSSCRSCSGSGSTVPVPRPDSVVPRPYYHAFQFGSPPPRPALFPRPAPSPSMTARPDTAGNFQRTAVKLNPVPAVCAGAFAIRSACSTCAPAVHAKADDFFSAPAPSSGVVFIESSNSSNFNIQYIRFSDGEITAMVRLRPVPPAPPSNRRTPS